MSCEQADQLVEAFAAGEVVPAEAMAHFASCARCADRLTLARRIDTLLASRPVPRAPDRLASDILVEIRRARWRAEQVLDWTFNLAVAGGLLMLLFGALKLIW